MINILLAWNFTGPAHPWWLAAALAVFISRVISFGYFIPEMIRKIMKPETIETPRLKAIVKRWTALSPIRLVIEFIAWILLVASLIHH